MVITEDIYGIFLDIDGTLIYNSHTMSERVVKSLMSAQKKGHKIFLNSGRSTKYIPPELKNQFAWDGLVTGCGSSVNVFGKNVFEKYIDLIILKKVCDFYFSRNLSCLLEGEDILLSINEDYHPQKTTLHSTDEFMKLYKDCKINKLTMQGKLFEEGKNILLKYFDLIQYENYAELVLKGVSKGEGMLIALKNAKIDKSIAIGDSLNDVEMLKKADISVAMGNSSPQIKKLCKFTTQSVENDGVAVFLNNFLQGEKDEGLRYN